MSKIKVELLVPRAGIGFSQNIGEVIEIGIAEGKRLVDAGQAAYVGKPPVETAAKEEKPAETAVAVGAATTGKKKAPAKKAPAKKG